MSDGAMTTAERDAFLRDQHVAILAIDEPGRGPLALPIWYLVDDDGDVLLSMGADTVKGRLLNASGRATVTVQTEDPPYKYVSVEGPVTIGPVAHDPLELATRYLGSELGQWYVDANPSTDQTVTVRLHPEHWRTYDFAKVL